VKSNQPSFFLSESISNTAIRMDATAPVSVMHLATQYGIDVKDNIQCSFDDGPIARAEPTDKTGAGAVLAGKILDALQHWTVNGTRYSDSDIAKVGGLVARNMYTVHSSQVKKAIEQQIKNDAAGTDTVDIPRLTVDLMLKGLFDHAVKRDRAVHVNSNEPVLLINFDEPQPRDAANHVIDITSIELRHKWNILPVRVYAGSFMPSKTVVEGELPGGNQELLFSITVLNVVNTDIGGPSMPQLLDADCDDNMWLSFMRREVWRGHDLVNKEEGLEGYAHDAQDGSERSVSSETEDDKSVGSDVLAPSDAEDTNFETEGQEASTDAVEPKAQSILLPESSVERDVAEKVSEEPEASEIMAEDEPVPVREIEHPTWDRSHDSVSLLDLIKSQVLTIAPFGTEAENRDDEARTGGSSTAPPEKPDEKVDEAVLSKEKPASEEDFVVV
jgi:hypothetical protein